MCLSLKSVVYGVENISIRWVKWNKNYTWGLLLGQAMQLSQTPAHRLLSHLCTIRAVSFWPLLWSWEQGPLALSLRFLTLFPILTPQNKSKLQHLCFWVSHLRWSVKPFHLPEGKFHLSLLNDSDLMSPAGHTIPRIGFKSWDLFLYCLVLLNVS